MEYCVGEKISIHCIHVKYVLASYHIFHKSSSWPLILLKLSAKTVHIFTSITTNINTATNENRYCLTTSTLVQKSFKVQSSLFDVTINK